MNILQNKNEITVVVPVYWGQHNFVIKKASPWSAIDHLFLQAIVDCPASANLLATKSNLPKQLIIEIMIPMLKVGWVQIHQTNEGYIFEATPAGIKAANLPELPARQKIFPSRRSFIIDPHSDKCMRLNEKSKDRRSIRVYGWRRKEDLISLSQPHITEITIHRVTRCNPSTDEIFEVIREHDETVIDISDEEISKSYQQNQRYILATVDENDIIHGLPSNATDELKSYILLAAQKRRQELEENFVQSSTQVAKFNSEYLPAPFSEHEINESEYDLILGAEQHKNHLFDIIDHAKSRLIIHSTFINPEAQIFSSILEKLILAAKRNVQIDILWGQNDPENQVETATERNIAQYKRTIETLNIIKQRIASEALQTVFTIHLEPTQSHAKLIIADHETLGYITTIGSCNWLASSFRRFEASVCIHYPPLVVEALSIMSRLAKGLSRVSTDLSKDLARMAHQVRKQHDGTKSNIPRLTTIKLIAQDQHHEFVRRARDEAKKKVFLCSHRMSNNQDRPILAPLKTLASQDNSDIEINLYYGTVSGGLQNPEAIKIQSSLTDAGINIMWMNKRMTQNLPEFHAKILSWDNNDVIITSLNWLSAQGIGDDLNEIGVYIHGSQIAEQVIEAFKPLINIHEKKKSSKR